MTTSQHLERGAVALVTGAAGGIGAATARELARQGVRLALTDRRGPALESLANELEVQGARIWRRAVDASNQEVLPRLIDDVESEVGAIRYLANTLGVLRTGSALSPEPQVWCECTRVNFHASFTICQLVAARMQQRRQGSLVAVSSNAASVPRVGMAAYAASKAALSAALRCLALELAPHGVRCNIVSPGSTDTPMLRELGVTHEHAIAGDPTRFRLGIPLGRVADPADVSHAIVFLLSDAARHITLHDLRVDGAASLGS